MEALRPLTLGKYRGQTETEDVDEETHSGYSSLLGGIAWTVLSRADAAVYIQALQRRSHKPRIIDCRRMNLCLRYITRHKKGIMYEAVIGEVRLVGFTDSAFKALEDEGSGLALRGLAILLTSDVVEGKSVLEVGRTYNVNLLEWLVRKLRRVVRSTFAAELNALIDSIETLILLQLLLHQIYCGTEESNEELLVKLECGGLYPPIDLLVDAKSVSDAVAAPDTCTPQEASLKLHIKTIRDRLARGLLRSLSWCDTRDMLADGLTKGGVDRSALSLAMSGKLKILHECVTMWRRQISQV